VKGKIGFKRINRLSKSKCKASIDQVKTKLPTEVICVKEIWMKTSRFIRCTRFLDRLFETSPQFLTLCTDFSVALEVMKEISIFSDCNTFPVVLKKVWFLCGDIKQHYLIASLLLMLKYGSSETRWDLKERVQDLMNKSLCAHTMAFELILQKGVNAYKLVGSSDIRGTKWDDMIPTSIFIEKHMLHRIESIAEDKIKSNFYRTTRSKCLAYKVALQGIQLMAETFLDAHKENAFKSAIQEPAQFYFGIGEDYKQNDHAYFQAIKGYLFILKRWFGYEIPISLHTDHNILDINNFGTTDIWSGISDDAWEKFKDEANFGRNFENVQGLNQGMLRDINDRLQGRLHAFEGGKGSVVDMASNQNDLRFLPYAQKFAFFFRKAFFVEKMFAELYAQKKTEYTYFKNYCNDLYPLFKEEQSFSEDTLFQCLYNADLCCLDIDRTARFFWFCGILKEGDAQVTWNVNSRNKLATQFLSTSQIFSFRDNPNKCYNECNDEKREISQKVSTSNQREQGMSLKLNKELEAEASQIVEKKNMLLHLIIDFVRSIKEGRLSEKEKWCCSPIKVWYAFEVEHCQNPKIIHYVTSMIANDFTFHKFLQTSWWMTPVAGIIFRFYSILIKDNLDPSHTHKSMFISYYEQIKNLALNKKNAQSHGELYCQAAIAYLCALRTGQRKQEMESVFNEISLLVGDTRRENTFQKEDLKREVQKRISLSSMKIIGVNLLGKKRYDPISNLACEGYLVLSNKSVVDSCEKFPRGSRRMNRAPNSLGAKAE